MSFVKASSNSGTTSLSQRGFYYGYLIVIISCLILIVTQGTYYSFGVFFKPLSEGFGWTRAMTSGAFSLCVVLHGALYIVTGRINDKTGPRLVMTVCGFLLGAGYILMSRTTAIWQLYLFYGVIVAMGLSGGWITLTSSVSRWFIKRRSLMTGIVAAGGGLGALVVPILANQLIATYQWQASYLIVGSAAIIIILIAAQFLRRDPTQVGQVAYGTGEAKTEGVTDTSGFTISEALRTRQLWMFLVANMAFGFSSLMVMVHIVPHATDLGVSPAGAAMILTIIGAIGAVGRVTIGAAGDKIGNKRTLLISFILLMLAMGWLMLAKQTWAFYLFAVIFGVGYGGSACTVAPLVADLFGLKAHGIIYGVITFGITIGGSIGPLVAGYIYDKTGAYQLAFIICIALALAGLTLAFSLKPIKESKPQPARNGTSK